MPRFGLKQIFLCTTLIAIGAALLAFTFAPANLDDDKHLRVIAFVIGSSFIGAGIAAPFKQAALGAMFGPIVAAIWFMISSILHR